MSIAKYFWDLNEAALKETELIIKSPGHPKFSARMVTLLSRCDKPGELFAVLPRETFMEAWPKIRTYWLKHTQRSDFRDWWETMYEQMVEQNHHEQKKVKGATPASFRAIGRLIKERRIEKGLRQKQLGLAVNMKQPDVSKVEEGK